MEHASLKTSTRCQTNPEWMKSIRRRRPSISNHLKSVWNLRRFSVLFCFFPPSQFRHPSVRGRDLLFIGIIERHLCTYTHTHTHTHTYTYTCTHMLHTHAYKTLWKIL